MPSNKIKMVAVNDIEYGDVDTGKRAFAKKGKTVLLSQDDHDSLLALKAIRKPKTDAEKATPVNEGAGIFNEAPATGATGDREQAVESTSSDTGTASGEIAATSSSRKAK